MAFGENDWPPASPKYTIGDPIQVAREREAMRDIMYDVDEKVIALVESFCDSMEGDPDHVQRSTTGLAYEIQLVMEHWLITEERRNRKQ